MKPYKNIVSAVKEASQLYANNIAIKIESREITYTELIETAEKWAEKLLFQASATRLKRVIVVADRSATSYVGCLAALLAGAAFIPLNPNIPANRNALILAQCQPEFIIVDERSLLALHDVLSLQEKEVNIFCPQRDKIPNKDNCIFPLIHEQEHAYILFTSGSTGQPKGVPIKHKNIYSFLSYCQKRYQISPEDRLSQTFEQTFDLSMFDLFMAWMHGAAVIGMRPIDLLSPIKYINENRISVWFSVPSVINLLLKQNILYPGLFPGLRLSLFCGEALYDTQIQAWSQAAPNSICENLYGPTELTVACSVYTYKAAEENITKNNIVSIGKIFPHLDYVLLSEDEKVNTVEGELCIKGLQRFDGYLNLPETTENSMIYLCNQDQQISLYYKTGDRVRLDHSGNLLYLGRKDQQIKLNGHRIELSEIESVFLKTTGVKHAIAFLYTTQKELAIVLAGNVTIKQAVDNASKFLPIYMIPKHIKIVDDIPLNINGKIDRYSIQSKFNLHTQMRENL